MDLVGWMTFYKWRVEESWGRDSSKTKWQRSSLYISTRFTLAAEHFLMPDASISATFCFQPTGNRIQSQHFANMKSIKNLQLFAIWKGNTAHRGQSEKEAKRKWSLNKLVGCSRFVLFNMQEAALGWGLVEKASHVLKNAFYVLFHFDPDVLKPWKQYTQSAFKQSCAVQVIVTHSAIWCQEPVSDGCILACYWIWAEDYELQLCSQNSLYFALNQDNCNSSSKQPKQNLFL